MGKSKAKAKPQQIQKDNAVDAGRGTINDNFLAALVTSKVYRMRVVKAKKGKGAFQRKDKHRANKGRESYLIAA